MDLSDAQKCWLDILSSVSPSDVPELIKFVNESSSETLLQPEAMKKLSSIVKFLRKKTDLGGNLPSQTIVWPSEGSFGDCKADCTEQVDSFLYDEVALEKLKKSGKVTGGQRCADCGSCNVVDMSCISHSLSVAELEYLFYRLLPKFVDLTDKVLVDIGSRLGAIVYAAVLFSPQIKHVYGLEISEGHCKLQNEALAKLQATTAATILCGDFRQFADTLAGADVVFMNNVFSFFADKAEQTTCWQATRSILKSGTLLVHNLTVEYVTNHLDLGFSIDEWLQLLHPSDVETAANRDADHENEFTLCIYRVK